MPRPLSLLLPSIHKPHNTLPSLLLFTRSNTCSRVLAVAEHESTDDFAENFPLEFHRVSGKIARKLSEPNARSQHEDRDYKKRLREYSSLLHDSAAKGSLKEGKLIHGHVIKCGLELDSHLWVSLINAYAKCGTVVYAQRVLNIMPQRDVVSWSALITGFVAQGYGSDGVCLFCAMQREGVRPNEFALATCLKACSMSHDVGFGKQVHLEAVKLGFFSDLFVGSALVDLYAKCGEMELAERVFKSMPELNVVSWNALLNGYAENGDGQKVMHLFCRMKDMEKKFSKFSLSTVLKGFANSGYIKAGQVVHAMAIRLGCALDKFLSCSLVDMYSKSGLGNNALKVFYRIKDPDVVAWGAIITCLDQQGCCQEAAKIFNLMRESSVKPNQFVLTSLVRATTETGDQRCGESIHAVICKYGFESDTLVGNALVSMYMENGRVSYGSRVFEAIAHQDSVSWNALLSGFQDYESPDQGLRIFYQMLLKGFKPNMCTFIVILKACSSLSDVGFGKQLHAHTIKHSLDGNHVVGTSLVDMYAKSGCLEDAGVAFDSLANKDLFAYTAIITSYAQAGEAEMALKCFRKMRLEGIKPNEFTLSSCLNGCSPVATLANGRLLHSIAVKTGHLLDMFVSTALVAMYAKCGSIDDAEAVFKGSVLRDTASWNMMIGGYVKHGLGEKALEAFRMMLDEGYVPDEITFVVVLSACSHMGLIEEGKKHFSSIKKIYGITPTIKHFACMIDILGRAGKFTEIENFITETKLTPNALVWENLLGACSWHGNIELDEKDAEKLLELEPKMESNYVFPSDISATQGRWNDFSGVRALLSSQGIKKESSCSWIEVDGRVHIFKSQDGSHLKIKEIYIKLDELVENMISVGHMPIAF